MFWPPQLFIRQCFGRLNFLSVNVLANLTFIHQCFGPLNFLSANLLVDSTFVCQCSGRFDFFIHQCFTQLFVNVTQWESRLYGSLRPQTTSVVRQKEREREREPA